MGIQLSHPTVGVKSEHMCLLTVAFLDHITRHCGIVQNGRNACFIFLSIVSLWYIWLSLNQVTEQRYAWDLWVSYVNVKK